MTINDIIDNRYKLLRKIGQGSFGEVWYAEDLQFSQSHYYCALKFYLKMDEQGLKDFEREFLKTKGLSHTNLLTPSHYAVYEDRPYLVMDYCNEGAASKYKGQVDEDTVWRFIHDVAAGLAYMHRQNPPLIHQDIKPANVLIKNGQFLIADFGICHSALGSSLNGSSMEFNYAGTTAYMGPERFKSDYVAIKASDIWSLGASIYELATGKPPYDGYGGATAKAAHYEDPQLPASRFSTTLNNLMLDCLKSETWERPTAEQLTDYVSAILKGEKHPPTPWRRHKKRKKVLPMVSIALVVCLSVIVILFILNRNNPSPKPHPVTHQAIISSSTGDVYYWTGLVISDSIPDGYGTIDYLDADRDGRSTYQGKMVNGKRESDTATLKFTNGNTYEGSFVNDHYGKGVFTSVNYGMFFKGEFRNDQPYNGTWYLQEDGSVYQRIVNGNAQ